MFTLLWWLGPWMDQQKSPSDISLDKIPISNGEFELFVYRSQKKKSKGAIYVIPGLHYEGPEDIRLDRFARVLAASGMIVGVPALPTMKNLIMTPSVWEENIQGFECFLQLELPKKPGVFSISAASIVAFQLGAHERWGRYIREMLTFGGYVDWSESLIFSLDGKIDEDIYIPVDPLGMPVIFLNLLEQLSEIQDKDAFKTQLLQFVTSTWEKEEMQSFACYAPLAKEISRDVALQDRELFLQACGVEEGGVDIIRRIILDELYDSSWLQPKQFFHKMQTKVTVAHGREDGVIPFTQAERLWGEIGLEMRGGYHVTGIYHHTGLISLQKLLRMFLQLPTEVWNSIGLVRSIARVGGVI